MTTWNQFGLGEVLLISLASVGFLAVVYTIVVENNKMDKQEKVLRKVNKLIGELEPEERVLDDTKVGLTDPD